VFLKQRWQDLFGASFDVLLYDLTSTYFESGPPFEEDDKRRYGYSRDHCHFNPLDEAGCPGAAPGDYQGTGGGQL